MDVLTQDVRKFLTQEMKFESANQFLAFQTATIASRYELWREANGKPSLRQDSKSVVYAWKQEVTRKLRGKDNNKSNGSQSSVPQSGTTRSISLPFASKKRPSSSINNGSSSNSSGTNSAKVDVTPPRKKKQKRAKPKFTVAPPLLQTRALVVVSTPHPNDVLSGRGGLTNSHQGNEFYRRLVRCSRGFYKNCPKHTKLLVAKAIVRAIHSQTPRGRFLENDKVNNIWKEIEDKRAVEKSSQALRERWEQGDDDDVLQRSMTVMFNKKLQMNTYRYGSPPPEAVGNAVYFAVMSVAMEFARRWGSQGVSSLAEQLRPIVKTAGDTAIPRPNGRVPLQKVTAGSDSAPEKSKSPSDTLSTKDSASTTSPVVADNPPKAVIPSTATYHSKTLPVLQARTSTEAAADTQSSYNNKSSTTTAGAARGSGTTKPGTTVPAPSPSKLADLSQARSKSFHNTASVKSKPSGKTAVSPPLNRPVSVSHSFGSAAPFSSLPRNDNASASPATNGSQQNAKLSLKSPQSQRKSMTNSDTFGTPVPPKVVKASSKKVKVCRESGSSLPQRPSVKNAANEEMASVQGTSRRDVYTPPTPFAAVKKSKGVDTFGQSITPSSHGQKMMTSNGTRTSAPSKVSPSPLSSTDNGFNTGKRAMLRNIATAEEIEAEGEQRPRNHGMSPFHREILKMNLEQLVD